MTEEKRAREKARERERERESERLSEIEAVITRRSVNAQSRPSELSATHLHGITDDLLECIGHRRQHSVAARFARHVINVSATTLECGRDRRGNAVGMRICREGGLVGHFWLGGG